MISLTFDVDLVCLADVEIMVHPGILDARNYFSWQKLFDKNHALLLRIQNNLLDSRTLVANCNVFDKFTHICCKLWNFCQESSTENNFCQESSTENNFWQESSTENNFCWESSTENNFCQDSSRENNYYQESSRENNFYQESSAENNF